MTDQPSLFDRAEAIRQRDEGLKRVAWSNAEWIATARITAERIARERGEVTADDVRAELYPRGIKPEHSNAFGVVFRGKKFRHSGRYRVSAVPHGHGNRQVIWELR